MPVRVFKDVEFHRWAKGEGITDVKLCAAADEIESGLINARLGGVLIKKRVGAFGRGKRGGFRAIAAHRQGERLVFLHGFVKNEKDDISPTEEKALRKLGDEYMAYSNAELSKLVQERLIVEVRCDEQNS
jgi:hypothetical protein